MTLEPRNEATDGTSVRYFTRSSIPGNRVGRRWNFDENIYYNEPEWLPEDDEQPDDFEIKDVYDYPLHKTHKNIEKRAPVKKSLVPLINITRCAYITHVPGIQETDLEYLNKWYQKYWRAINSSEFNYINLSDYIKNDILYNYKDPVKIQMYLGAQKILYNTGTIGDGIKHGGSESMSKSPNFRHFFSLALKNPVSLNSLIIMTNCVIMMKETLQDHDAQLIIVDVLLSCYPCALENFVKLGGVSHIKAYLDYLASNSVLDAHTNYLLKCFSLLGQLDITLDVLKQSKIGIPVNIIASGKINPKGTVQYECSDIGVKVKAADLIKRWKSIRDEAIQKPLKNTVKITPSGTNNNATSSSVNKDTKNLCFAKGVGNCDKPSNGEGKGSFVLNILDTLVEEHEKGRKRKQELRNAHKSTSSRKLEKKIARDSILVDSTVDKNSIWKNEPSDTVHGNHSRNYAKYSVDYNQQNSTSVMIPVGIPVITNPSSEPLHHIPQMSSVDHSYNKLPQQHVMPISNVQNADMQLVPPTINYNGVVNRSVNYHSHSNIEEGDSMGSSETAKVQSLLNFFRTNEANKMGCQGSAQ